MESFKDITEMVSDTSLDDTETSQNNESEFIPNHTFTDEDRRKGQEVRKAQADIKLENLRQEREIGRFQHLLKIEELRSQAIELRLQRQEMRESMNVAPENDTEDSMLKNIIELAKMGIQQMQQKNQVQIQAATSVNINPAGYISDQEIEEYYAKIPPFLIEKAKADTNENIKRQIIQFRPELSNESIERIIARIRK